MVLFFPHCADNMHFTKKEEENAAITEEVASDQGEVDGCVH